MTGHTPNGAWPVVNENVSNGACVYVLDQLEGDSNSRKGCHRPDMHRHLDVLFRLGDLLWKAAVGPAAVLAAAAIAICVAV